MSHIQVNSTLPDAILGLIGLAEHCSSCPVRENIIALSLPISEDVPENCRARSEINKILGQYGAAWQDKLFEEVDELAIRD